MSAAATADQSHTLIKLWYQYGHEDAETQEKRMIKNYLSSLSLCLVMALGVNAQETETPQSILPINEPLTDNTGSFTNAVLMTGTNVNGIIATGGKGTATFVLDTDQETEGVQAYEVAENEVVTFSWVGYHGWQSNAKADNVTILNSQDKALFSAHYTLGSCFITDIKIGDETPVLFEAFKCQGDRGSGGANGWDGKGKPYSADNANNTVYTVKVYGKGYVEVNLKNEKQGVDKTYSSMLPEGFKVDLASLNLTNVGKTPDRALGINQLSITSAESTVKFVDYTVNRVLEGEEGTVLGTYTATNIDKATVTLPQSPWYAEDGQKYIYTDDDADSPLTEGAVYTIYYRAAEKYAWTLNAVDADANILKEGIATGETFEGDNVTIGFPRYVRVEVAATEETAGDTLLYSTSEINKEYRKTVAIESDNQPVNIVYTATDKHSIVYYSEAEEVNSYYLKELTTGNAAVRASQGRAAYLGYDAQLVQLSAGVYEVTAGLFDASSNASAQKDTVRFGLGRSVALEFVIDAINLSEQTKQIVVPSDGSWLSWMKGGNEKWGLDYVFVQKVSDEVPYTAAASIAEAKALPNGTPVALTLNNAKVSLSTVTDEDMYPSYSFIEDETGALALSRMFASTVQPNIVKDNSYTGTIYGSFAFDTFGRPVFSETAKTAASEITPTPCEIVPAEVTVGTINTEAGFADYYGKYVTLKNVTWGKKEDAWGGSDYYLVATHTEGEGEEAVEVSDSIYFYDQYYQFPANIPNFISFNSIRGFVDKFYDGTVTFYPYGEYDAVLKPATKAANIGALKEVTAGDDVILTLDKAVVTAYLQGHSGNIVLLEDATGGIQVQTGNIWWGEAGLTDMLGLTRDSLEISGTIYCRLEANNMIVMNDSTETRSVFTVNPELVPVNPTVVTLDKVLDNNYLNRLLKVKKVSSVNVGTADPYYPEYVMMEPYFVQGTDTVGIYDMFNVLEYDEQYNVVEIPNIKSVTGIIIKGSEATDWSPATPNTLAPVAIEKMTFKEFTENEYFIPTAEAVAQAVSEGWFEGGETLGSDKNSTIDPLEGWEIPATMMPYAGLEKGNDAKTVTVYVTGLTEIRGIAASTSSTANRALEISAENVADGTIAYAYADNAPNTSSVATLALDPEAQYIVSFAGVDDAHENGGDVALFGIWFLKDATATGVKDINANADIESLTNGEVYNLNGVRVREAGQGLNGLKKGVYLMKNGKKVVVK